MARDRAFWLTALAVAGVFVFALFVRTYWNVEAATPGGTFLLSESDAYYEHHTAEEIQRSGWSHPIQDPLVNYPVGGINPNPPLWEWWIATWGALLSPVFGGDAANHPVACPAGVTPSQATCVSTWWVTEFSPALFGAFTVLVVVLIGREVWDWRAGLLAGFLAATSTSHIERSVFGFADHDSFVLFFIVLGFYFFIRALNAARDQKWVERWGNMDVARGGLASYFRANQLSLAFAGLAGVAFAGVALSWKGEAFAAGILLVFGVVQTLVNHWRRRDSTHLLGTITVALLVNVLLIVPYYANPALGAIADTLLPLLFILVAWVAFGVIFTASRDMPFVLVLPVALVVGFVALAVAFVVAPSVAQSLLAPLVYFKQTKLYTTIAEAHPADFNSVVFGTGLAGFFVALFAIPYLLWLNRKTWRTAWTFVGVWALLALFMTNSAVRFMFNATPVIALLGGWGIGLIVARLRFESIGKNLAGLGGFSRTALKRAVNAWHVVGVFLLAVFLVMPNVILAVDAGMPAQYEDKLIRDELTAQGKADTDANRAQTFVGARFGAFGQGFISDYWRELFQWLATQDTNQPPEARPAFLSWWDYGHWALSLGHHPAVADNFQNGFQFAGNFIVAQNETHAIQLFIARLQDRVEAGEFPKETFLNAFTQAGLGASDAAAAYDALGTYQYAPQLPLDKAVAALRNVEAATQHSIRYFAVDVRLFPYDNPATSGIDFSSIFYAPVTLSDHNPDDYVEAVIKTTSRIQGKNEFTNAEFTAMQKDPSLLQALQASNAVSVYKYKAPFFDTMFYRTYIGTPIGLNTLPATDCDPTTETFPVEGDRLPGLPMPGFCMEHFRLVYYDSQVRMLKYTPGAVLKGQVTVDGKPLDGARVVAYDDAGDDLYAQSSALLTDAFKSTFNTEHGRDIGPRDFDVPHGVATTDAQGNYEVLVPFSTKGQVTVRAFKDAAEVGSVAFPVTEAQAEAGLELPASQGAIQGTSGLLQGKVFFDADRSRAFSEGDVALQGAKVSLDGDVNRSATTDADGNYAVSGVAPGQHTVRATLADHEMVQAAEASVAMVQSGRNTTFNVAMSLTKAQVDGTVWQDANADSSRGADEGIRDVPVKALPDFRTAGNTALEETPFSKENGTLSFTATPGKYVVRGEWVDPDDSSGYAFGTLLDIAKGTGTRTFADNATHLVRATRATVNLTLDNGNGTSAGATTSVLFVPTQGGIPAAERTAVNGTLSLWLVPGTYDVYAAATSEGFGYTLGPRPYTVPATGPAPAFEGTLTRQG
jgi:dolichyl-phosphooligosaccharide-protein glycotransferase